MIPFTVTHTRDEILNRIQDRIRASLSSIVELTVSAGALVANQILFGGPSGDIAQSSNLKFEESIGTMTIANNSTAGVDLKVTAPPVGSGFTSAAIRFRADGSDSGPLIQASARIANNLRTTINALLFSIKGVVAQDDIIAFASTIAPGNKTVLAMWPGVMGAAIGSATVLAPAATEGHLYIPTVSGPPTGIPSRDGDGIVVDRKAIVLEVPAGVLWAYFASAWHAL